jgi:hypothetical protein
MMILDGVKNRPIDSSALFGAAPCVPWSNSLIEDLTTECTEQHKKTNFDRAICSIMSNAFRAGLFWSK